MPAFAVDLRSSEDLRDIVHRGVEALGSGKLVALPTETVYGVAASALDPNAVKRLLELNGAAPPDSFALAIKGLNDAHDYVPDMSKLAVRVARKYWPGPVTLVLNGAHSDSVITRLPDAVRQFCVPEGRARFRVPDHPVTMQIMRLLAGPLVLISAKTRSGTEISNGDELLPAYKDEIDLILNDGASRFGSLSSVVMIQGNTYKFLRNGVLTEDQMGKLSSFSALVVCTGNTCRSPMGEALLKELLAAKTEIPFEELEQHGIHVASAGVAAMPGGLPSPQAVEVMTRMGLDISGHESQPINDTMAKSADMIFTMTNRHRAAILAHWPELNGRVHTVMRDGSDVSDPIGMPVDIYQSCAEQVKTNLGEWVESIELPEPPQPMG